MISGIGSSTNYYSSLFAAQGTSNGSSGTSGLAQTEEKLFARIDTNGDGSLSQSEFTSFLDQAGAATGSAAPSTAQANALFAQMSNGGNSISLQQFESNAGDLVTALQKEIAAGSSSASSASSTSELLSQLTQSAQSLVAGSAAGITSRNSSNATSNTNSSNSTGHHHHHGHGGAGSLISQFMQQYQAAGATTTTTAATTLSTTA
jgi:hypothetical protein